MNIYERYEAIKRQHVKEIEDVNLRYDSMLNTFLKDKQNREEFSTYILDRFNLLTEGKRVEAWIAKNTNAVKIDNVAKTESDPVAALVLAEIRRLYELASSMSFSAYICSDKEESV